MYLAAHKLICRDRVRRVQPSTLKTPRHWLSFLVRVTCTFHLVCLTWLFFRAESFEQAWLYLTHMAQGTLSCDLRTLATVGFYMCLTLLVDLPCWAWDRELPLGETTSWYVRGIAQAAAVILISFVGASGVAQFIYFQF